MTRIFSSTFSALVLLTVLVVLLLSSLALAEQFEQGFSTQEVQRLSDFYWQVSKVLLADKQYDQAIAQAQRILELQPNNPTIQTYISQIQQEKQSSFTFSQEAFVPMPYRGEAANPTSISRDYSTLVSTRLQQARSQYYVGNYNDALMLLNEVLIYDPQNGEASAMRNQILNMQNSAQGMSTVSMQTDLPVQYQQAQQDLRAIQQQQKIAQERARLDALAAQQRREVIEQRVRLDQLSEKEQERVRKINYLLSLADEYYRNGDYQGVIRSTQPIFAIDPNNAPARALYDIARKQMYINEARDAREAQTQLQESRQMSEKEQKRIKKYLEKAEDAYADKDFDEALKLIDAALLIDAQSNYALSLREVVMRAKQVSEASAGKELSKTEEEQARLERARAIEGVRRQIEEQEAISKQSEYAQEDEVASSYDFDERIPEHELEKTLLLAHQAENEMVVGEEVDDMIKRAKKEYDDGEYQNALSLVNQILIWNMDNVEALSLKEDILSAKREDFEAKRNKRRTLKAKLFRGMHRRSDDSYSEADLLDIEEFEKLRQKIEKTRFEKRKMRQKKAEERIRDDVRKRMAMEEEANLDAIIEEVENSKFYEKFKKYAEQKDQKELLQKRQIQSFLLRAEGLMEMKRFEEAAVYLNNVFMVEPYNERAQKMREELEKEIAKKKERDMRIADKLFEEEKEAYKDIREQVREKKITELLYSADKLYEKEEWLEARQAAQKVLIIDPSNSRAKKLLSRVDKELLELQRKYKRDKQYQFDNRAGAMSEAVQDAARALEMQMIENQKEELDTEKRIKELLLRAQRKVELEQDYDSALVELNRAYALDVTDTNIVAQIERVRALQAEERQFKQLTEAQKQERAEEIKEQVQEKRKDILSLFKKQAEADQKALEEKQENAERREWEEFNQSKRILEAAAEKNNEMRVQEYIDNARKMLEENQYDLARKEVKKIFLFDPQNPDAKDMLEQITEYEIKYDNRLQAQAEAEAFKKGLELEKLKVALNEKKTEDVVREPEVARVEDKRIRNKTVKQLIREGKKLYKEKRYYEALNKFEGVFAFESQNSTASKYIDRIKEAMIEQREEAREEMREEQRKEIASRLKKIGEDVRMLHAKGRFTEAAILIEKGLLLDPTNNYFTELKKYNERGAREQMHYETSEEADIKNLINLGIKEYIQGNYKEAKDYFEKVLEIDPSDEKAKRSIEKIDEKMKSLNL